MDGDTVKIHPGWIRFDGNDELQRSLAQPIKSVHATDGRAVRVHNVEWEGKHLISVVIHNEQGKRIPTALGYREALELAEKLIEASKIQRERMNKDKANA